MERGPSSRGSSGQQIVEAIQSFVGRLTIFVRQPNWIFGPFGPEPRAYTKEEIEEFEQKPDVLLQLRKQNEVRINSYFESCIKDSEAQTGIRNYLTQSMREKLQNSELEDLFIPKWAVGCRRPTPGHRYLECLTSDNVSVVHGSIDQIIPSGCISNGIEHDLEVLICATGFDTSYRPRFPLIGFDGVDLQQEWENDPKAYMAIAAPYMPNYFIFYGPNNPFASGPFLASIEAQADYMLKWCDRWQTENIQSFAPKAIAVDELQAHTKEILRTTVWADTCRSWYKAHETDSKNMKMWPGSGLHYIEAISEIRADDWDVTYVGNRFAWLGNGFSRTEVDPTSDRSYYIRNHDDGLYLSREKRRKLLTEKREKREILDF
ncbi:hypothetical protein MMC17_008734 [Xylographa soralifera]|nr:hypothetical protein [Xylographa soralifera]